MVVARLILVFLNTPVEKLIFFSMISTEAKISLNRLFLSFSKPGITSYVANQKWFLLFYKLVSRELVLMTFLFIFVLTITFVRRPRNGSWKPVAEETGSSGTQARSSL